MAWHATRPLPFLSTASSPHLAHHRQRAGSRLSRPAAGGRIWCCIMTLEQHSVRDSSPPMAADRCAWVDEVLRE